MSAKRTKRTKTNALETRWRVKRGVEEGEKLVLQEAWLRVKSHAAMTVLDIQQAIEALPDSELDSLTDWLLQRREQKERWPVAPPDVSKDEIRRIQARIDQAFGQAGS